MSGIAGIFNLDSEPVDRGVLGRMTEFMAYRGPDEQEIWVDGYVGFGHRMLRTSWEAEFEHQPFTLDQQVWIVADARVDDRETLADKLGLDFRPLTGAVLDRAKPNQLITDVEFILHAYLKWGNACVQHLLGDFAFAIWDSRHQRLFCARDQFGVKPFYYAKIRNSFLFSSSIDSLRHHPYISNRLNEEWIGDFLLFAHKQNPEQTIYTDIQSLAHAHSLFVTKEHIQKNRYWHFPTGDKIFYKKDQDYVDHFREIFSVAVADRLRTEKVSIAMSGGMDSSSIAAFACQKLRNSSEDCGLKAFTCTAGNLLPNDQEPYYAGIVADGLKIPIDYFSLENYHPYQRASSPELYCQQPIDDYKFSSSVDFVKLMLAHSRVSLTGQGGDPIFMCCNLYFISLLKRRRFNTFLQAATQYIFQSSGLRGLGLRSAVKQILGHNTVFSFDYPDWLNKDFANRNSLKDKYASFYHQPFDFSSPHPGASRCLSEMQWSTSFETDYDLNFSMETRHPFFDIRLIKYVFGINIGFWGQNKKILREAAKPLLPVNIINRPKTPLLGNLTLEQFKDWSLRPKQSYEIQEVEDFVEITKYLGTLEGYISTGESRYYSLTSPLSLASWRQNQISYTG